MKLSTIGVRTVYDPFAAKPGQQPWAHFVTANDTKPGSVWVTRECRHHKEFQRDEQREFGLCAWLSFCSYFLQWFFSAFSSWIHMQLIQGVLMTQTQLASSSRLADGQEVEVVDPVLTLCLEISRRLPQPFDEEAAAEKYPVEYTNSMNTVLRQELIRFNRLLTFIKTSLNDTRRAILGQLAMIPELERIYKSMAVGKLPAAWALKSYPSLKPLGSYINDFLARLTFLQRWLDEGEPTVYWLSGFYFTQSFLTGVLQNHSRKNNLQIDHLQMKFDVSDFEMEVQERPEMGVYLRVSLDWNLYWYIISMNVPNLWWIHVFLHLWNWSATWFTRDFLFYLHNKFVGIGVGVKIDPERHRLEASVRSWTNESFLDRELESQKFWKSMIHDDDCAARTHWWINFPISISILAFNFDAKAHFSLHLRSSTLECSVQFTASALYFLWIPFLQSASLCTFFFLCGFVWGSFLIEFLQILYIFVFPSLPTMLSHNKKG